MRYPDGNRRSNSITISGDSSTGGGPPLPLRFPSSSSTSQESQNSLPDPEDENDLPGRTPAGTTTAGGRANIETISEHVLFGNNNGHNSFLYLYYSSSSQHNNSRNSSNNVLKRPYTTTGGIKGGKIMGSEDGDSQQQRKLSQWNDLSGGRGSAGPSPIFYNNNEDEDEDGIDEGGGGKKGRMKASEQFTSTNNSSKTNDNSNGKNDNDSTVPYPVYLSPVEGSPIRLPSLSPKQKSMEDEDEDEDTRSSSRITGGPRRDRLDSFGADLLEDDWDKIYSVPDVDARYILSPDPSKVGTKRKQSENSSDPLSSCSTYQSHEYTESHKKDHTTRTFNKQKSTTSSNSLSVSKSNFHTSANSPSKTNKQGSIKRVRVTTDGGKWSGGGGGGGSSSMKKWSSTSSVRSGGATNKKLTPSSGPSRTPSTRSLKRGNSTRHGVTHHHHQPLSGGNNSGHNNPPGGPGVTADGKRVSSTTTGDGLDQMSFQFQNGIGAFFGTPASKQIAQKSEPTPEEMYKEEMQGWRPRLATGATIFTATLLILSCASLLFVFPILVDPILVGFDAEFSKEPVMCRTTNFRNGSGPSECATPSCREGCTLDLFSCIFVDVEYYPLSSAMNDNLLLEPKPNDSYIIPATSTFPTEETNSTFTSFPREKRSAILLVNVNGCGYPPDVTCSDFEKKFAPLNTQFPCYYSQQNESIVVPDYSRRTEIIHLTLAICIPFGVILVSAISLYLLVRYHKYLKATIYKKYAQRKNAIRTKRREDREKLASQNPKSEEEEEDDDVEEDATSISELEPPEEYNYRKNIKAMQNGASKTGKETRLMLSSTEM